LVQILRSLYRPSTGLFARSTHECYGFSTQRNA
jgi:hypothetical protein